MSVNRTVTSVESFCGHYLDYLDPRPENIELDDIARGLALTHRFASQINKRYCVPPESRVLTADLRWVPAGDLTVGDELIGFDAEPDGTKVKDRRRRRKCRGSRVLQTRGDLREIIRLDLEDGSSVRASAEHPWLIAWPASRNQKWRTAKGLLEDVQERGINRSLLRYVEPWKAESGWEAGYLAGLFDGEGCVSFAQGGLMTVTFAQRPGPVMDRMERALQRRGIRYSIRPSGNHSALNLAILGKWYDKAAVLGSLRPDRLNDKVAAHIAANVMRPELQAKELVPIIGGASEGLSEITALSTSSMTYFAEGFAAHNSVAEHAVYVRDLVIERGHPELGFPALHHDSHETYLGDWPSPLKYVIEMQAPGLLKKLARDIDVAICAKFGIDVDLLKHPVIKEADEYAMRREAATLKYSHGVGPHWGYTEALMPLAGIGWGEDRAEREFLKAHRQEMSCAASR